MGTPKKHATFVFAGTIMLVIGVYALPSAAPSFSSLEKSSSPSSSSGTSVTNSSGAGICCHFVGKDSAPLGCNTTLGLPTLTQGYSLEIHASSRTVSARGDALCITPVLRNINGTVVTYGTRGGRISFAFEVTDSNGRVVYHNVCPYYSDAPNFMSSYNLTQLAFSCTGVWYTTGPAAWNGITSTIGLSIQPGTYQVSCNASFPSLEGLDIKANASVTADLAVSALSNG